MVIRTLAFAATILGFVIGCGGTLIVEHKDGGPESEEAACAEAPDGTPCDIGACVGGVCQCYADGQCFDANPAAPACIHGVCQPSPEPSSCTYAPGDPPCDAGTWDAG